MSSPLKQNTATIESILEAINNLPEAGTDTLDATATASNILMGKTAYVSEGKVTGTMPNNGDVSGTIDGAEVTEITIPAGYTSGGTIGFVSTVIEEELDEQTDLIAQIQNTVDSLPEAGSGDPTLQEKTVSPTTSSQSVTPDSGYDGLSKVTVNAMPTATQAIPTVSIDSAGKITATATQTAGYVSAGTKTGTKQLTTQAAKTITPSTSSQTAVAKNVYTTGAVTVAAIPSTYVKPTATKAATTYTPTTANQTIAAGTYCSGVQTIKGDSNLVAGNIKSGVSIFGVAGSYEGNESSGGFGGVETVNVTIVSSTWNGTMWYTDISYQFNQLIVQSGEAHNITCIKNSIIIFSGCGFSADAMSSFEIGYLEDANMNGMYLYHFNSDTTIYIEGAENGGGLDII